MHAARDGEEFLRELEVGDGRTVVVVHVFDARGPASAQLNRHLDTLATRARCAEVKFVRVENAELPASARIDEVAIPALLLYRGGELFDSVLRAHDELAPPPVGEYSTSSTRGHDVAAFSADDVEWLLAAAGVRGRARAGAPPPRPRPPPPEPPSAQAYLEAMRGRVMDDDDDLELSDDD